MLSIRQRWSAPDPRSSWTPTTSSTSATPGTVALVADERDPITAAELDAMTPDQRQAAVNERIVTSLDDLPPAFRDRVVATAERLAAERRASPTP